MRINIFEKTSNKSKNIKYNVKIHQGNWCVNLWQLTSRCTAHAYAPTLPSRRDSETAPISTLTTPCTSTPPLNMLMLPQDHQDMPPTLPPHATYNPYAPAGPSRYASNTSTPCPPSSILILLHPCSLQSSSSHGALKICLQCRPQPL
ncbi:hypothetical protein O181_050877 [Austropuccinia psidii MF-1]|uniref:Uncharacterized protein n=1 Tax=Austropuccinia psidii MF-1 TaxID=1389203 RepID=A0A9Q3DZU4_9BASI|nr:hypothetical protein [Austropuccinia psidii MF-1]